ncbi:MAG: hypothetical protein KTM48_02435 [Wolbachia endosymbiont of Pissodes strobi]|nr:hypothetical protein [Wolbachia endosymbiont of Pissodes strobi]
MKAKNQKQQTHISYKRGIENNISNKAESRHRKDNAVYKWKQALKI